ncbi:MAG TPA: RDD family protein [Natronosporangium sp.]
MTDLPQSPQSGSGSPYPAYPQTASERDLAQEPYQGQAVAPDGRPLAGQGWRLLARIIDVVILLVAFLLVAGLIVGGLAALLTAVRDAPVTPFVVMLGIAAVVLGVYYVYEVEIPLRWNGQTPGKRLLDIAIAPLDPGSQLTRSQLAYRWLVMLGFNLLANCYIGYIDPLWCLWDKPFRQCLHDKPARTVVIKVEPA